MMDPQNISVAAFVRFLIGFGKWEWGIWGISFWLGWLDTWWSPQNCEKTARGRFEIRRWIRLFLMFLVWVPCGIFRWRYKVVKLVRNTVLDMRSPQHINGNWSQSSRKNWLLIFFMTGSLDRGPCSTLLPLCSRFFKNYLSLPWVQHHLLKPQHTWAIQVPLCARNGIWKWARIA